MSRSLGPGSAPRRTGQPCSIERAAAMRCRSCPSWNWRIGSLTPYWNSGPREGPLMAESASRAFMTEAKELADAGQFGKAIEVLQHGLKKFPKMVSARVLLGEIYWTSGDATLARVELEQVIKTTPDNFAAHRRLALIYRDVGDKHAAAKACEAVLQANPKDREMKDLLEEILGGPA